MWGDLNTDVGIAEVNFLSGGATTFGWVVGMGIEHALTENVLLRLDYSHMDFGTKTHNLTFAGGGAGPNSRVDAQFDTIKVGVSYKF